MLHPQTKLFHCKALVADVGALVVLPHAPRHQAIAERAFKIHSRLTLFALALEGRLVKYATIDLGKIKCCDIHYAPLPNISRILCSWASRAIFLQAGQV